MNNPAIPPVLNYLFSILAIFIFVGSLNSFLVYHSRLTFKMIEEKDLFALFQKTTKRTNMSYLAMLFLISLTVIFILWTSLFNVTNYFIIAVSVLKFITMISLIYLRIKDLNYQPLYRKPFDSIKFLFNYFCWFNLNYATVTGNITGNMWELWNCLIVLGVSLVVIQFFI